MAEELKTSIGKLDPNGGVDLALPKEGREFVLEQDGIRVKQADGTYGDKITFPAGTLDARGMLVVHLEPRDGAKIHVNNDAAHPITIDVLAPDEHERMKNALAHSSHPEFARFAGRLPKSVMDHNQGLIDEKAKPLTLKIDAAHADALAVVNEAGLDKTRLLVTHYQGQEDIAVDKNTPFAGSGAAPGKRTR